MVLAALTWRRLLGRAHMAVVTGPRSHGGGYSAALTWWCSLDCDCGGCSDAHRYGEPCGGLVVTEARVLAVDGHTAGLGGDVRHHELVLLRNAGAIDIALGGDGDLVAAVERLGNKMYQAVDSTYHFKYYQYIIGKPELRLYERLPFLIDEGICAAAIPARKACPEYVNTLRNAGIYVLVYTVGSDAEEAKNLLEMGVNTICTDYVTPADI